MNTAKQIEKANKPEELLDLVDKNDQVVGTVVRSDANKNPKLIHREVAVILIDSQDRVMLQKRSAFKSVNPSMWSVTAGHILKGEDPLKTAHTELQEELGFDTDLVFVKKMFHTYPWETHFTYYYIGKYTGEKITLESAEVEKTHFFTEEEIAQYQANGESINKNHFPLFAEYWRGGFKSVLRALESTNGK